MDIFEEIEKELNTEAHIRFIVTHISRFTMAVVLVFVLLVIGLRTVVPWVLGSQSYFSFLAFPLAVALFGFTIYAVCWLMFRLLHQLKKAFE